MREGLHIEMKLENYAYPQQVKTTCIVVVHQQQTILFELGQEALKG